MSNILRSLISVCLYALSISLIAQTPEQTVSIDSLQAYILTPTPALLPRINGAKVFGVHPKAPFIYQIPASGKRPMQFKVFHLPKGLKVDKKTGLITGLIEKAGEYNVTFRAINDLGKAEKKFKIIVGENITLTPPLGWNSWNCWASSISQEKTLNAARAMVASGLREHGFCFVNIDDGWQGERGGDYNGLMPDPKKFPNMKAMCDEIHSMGLKVGIYNTPWVKSYAGYLGGSSENEKGLKDSVFFQSVKPNQKILPWHIGKYSFAKQDANQYAQWGIDFLKYDWAPNETAEVKEMYDAIRTSGRDIVLSLSNNATQTILKNAPEFSKYAQLWRTTNDIRDTWKSLSSIGFNQDKYAFLQSPGHFNDPDMLILGYVGWGKPRPTRLTADEQFTHISMWCLLGAPLLLGCDMNKLDAFTLSLLTNDEVLEVDQDVLCKQALCIDKQGDIEIFAKPLEDGSIAVGLFNRGLTKTNAIANWEKLGITGKKIVRDLWRQKNIGFFENKFTVEVNPHGVVLVKIINKK
jgi:alpha-galactosidase